MKDRKGRVRGFKQFDVTSQKWEHTLRSEQSGRITAQQMESGRRIITKRIKKIGTYRLHIQQNVSVSKKPSEVRMGKGKGAIDHYITRVKAGQLLFSIQGVSPRTAETLFKKVQYKLPVQTAIYVSKSK